ncbi:Os04g0386100 [Oryza sativa Japonica Group]|uniref:Os04g0386100 protein n=1 Tax=Oryza sativa subsp. japonica TaxID=39947 RepID=A0A0P0W9S8_ORYSJ|nr:Os04g0386100 [Oryza sativa Japonica Group]
MATWLRRLRRQATRMAADGGGGGDGRGWRRLPTADGDGGGDTGRWWPPWLRWEEAWQPQTASRGRGRRLHLVGAATFGGGVEDRLGAKRRSRWQRRPARRERCGRRKWRPVWCEKRDRWREAGLAREARPVEEAGLAREARLAIEEAYLGARRSCHWVWSIFRRMKASRRGFGAGVPHVGRV